MGAAYSLDLRQRVWSAFHAGEGTEAQMADRFGVSLSFVRDLVRRVRETGSVAPKPHGGGRAPALDAAGLEQVALSVAEVPDATLDELVAQLRRHKQISLSRTALWRALQWLRLTRKKEGSPRQRKGHVSGKAAAAQAPRGTRLRCA